MSHTKNVDSFARIVDICTGFGGNYNPGRQNLQVKNLNALLISARQALTEVVAARTTVENAAEDRKKAFADIQLIASRMMAELRASGASAETIAAAASMVRKIQGRTLVARTKAAPEKAAVESTPAPKHPRTNGRDYGSVVYHFQKLIETASTEPLYQPLIAELQIVSLQKKLTELQNGNAAVSAAEAKLGQMRRDRNAVLYTGRESMASIAQAVKQSARAIFGASNESSQALAHIKINKTKKA